MIEFLSKWIEGIAVSVIIVSIFEMLLPNGNIKKYIKIILGIYIIFSIISPFTSKNSLYSMSYGKEFDIDSNKKEYSLDLDKIYKEALEKDIKETIEKQGFSVKKCYVDGNFNTEKKDVGIKKITVILKSNINIEKVEINMQNETNSTFSENEKNLQENIKNLTKILCEHYEIEQEIVEIRIR